MQLIVEDGKANVSTDNEYALNFFSVWKLRSYRDAKNPDRNTAMIKAILAYNATQKYDGMEELISEAAEKGYGEVIELLITDKRFDGNMTKTLNEACIKASKYNKVEAVEYLLALKNPNLNLDPDFNE